jgi:hypothetical protein
MSPWRCFFPESWRDMVISLDAEARPVRAGESAGPYVYDLTCHITPPFSLSNGNNLTRGRFPGAVAQLRRDRAATMIHNTRSTGATSVSDWSLMNGSADRHRGAIASLLSAATGSSHG